MTNRFLKIATMLAASLLQAQEGQLYLLTGFSTPKTTDAYDPTLLRVKEGGTVERVVDLMLDHGGTEWIGVSYDWRKAVFLAKLLPVRTGRRLVVVNFDDPDTIKSCEIPNVPGTRSLIRQWLSETPVRGPSFQQHLGAEDMANDVVQSMVLDAATPCERSFELVDPSNLAYMVANRTGILGSIDAEGMIQIRGTTKPHQLQYQIPLAMRQNSKEFDAVNILINDRELLLIHLSEGRSYRKLVFRKKDRTWHYFPVSTDQIIGFGRFVAVVEVSKRDALQTESAGQAEWQKKPSRTGPPPEDFLDEGTVKTGRLHLYDSETEQLFTIDTKQGDSEIVLVENHTVYYRVSDRLYAAPLSSTGIGRPRLLVKAEEIRDVHWAFIKH